MVFTPLTDRLGAFTGASDASISIGAVSVQPSGGTGIILAGTGDPNDALDSYYGAGILRSADGGSTWTLIQATPLAAPLRWSFIGEGIAGFAWSTVNPQLVVAAVTQAWEGLTVGAIAPNFSYEGLYYSTDAGSTWSLARIWDGSGTDIQGPTDALAGDGNGVTSVVWNPMRRLFFAAVRFHGYYQSVDGMSWTRLTLQPGSRLTTALCPTNSLSVGSPACPMFRGALAVNPNTGDTFAWTVDIDNQDQGIWQDVCAPSGGSCTKNIDFSQPWNTTALESATPLGAATILNGDYNLALAAIPSSQDTILLAGGQDVWQCSLAMGCLWRNTTNAFSCMSAGVGGYQHSITWNPANPLQVFVGNDSGLWRSMDAINETGSPCSPADSSHFQNLNGALGSLAEVESMSSVGSSPYTMMAGLGANGTPASNSTTGPTAIWPQILGGEGGPVAADPSNFAKWYINNEAGVSIHACAKGGACTPADFGKNPAVSNVDVGNDGLTMTVPAPFLVDPLDPSQLLVGTCRVWRGPVTGGWTLANAISPMLDGNRSSSSCSGNALIRSLAAMQLAGGGEIAYAGTYGSLNGGGTLPGHVLRATMSPAGVWSSWQDLTLNPVSNDTLSLNAYNFDISSLTLDPHDATGNTIYVTVAAFPSQFQLVQIIYRSTDGGAHWSTLKSNLPSAPANGVAIDPLDPNTAYLALDVGVYITRNVSNCPAPASNCWSAYGAGLPMAPVVTLSAAPATGSLGVLVAGTYGRGVWQIPLATAGVQLTTAAANPASLDFGHESYNTISAAQTVTLTNTGGITLSIGQISISGDFTVVTGVPSQADTCSNSTLNAGADCTVSVTFTPSQQGVRTGQLNIPANVAGSPLTVALTGFGDPAGAVNLSPPILDFAPVGPVPVGTTSAPLSITVNNGASTPVPITSLTMSGPFQLASDACGATSLAAITSCALTVVFQPTQPGPATGTLTLVDSIGTQTVQLKGTGMAPPADTLSPASLSFPDTVIGNSSSALSVTLNNSGDLPLTSIAAAVTGPFQTYNNCTTQLTGHASCSISVAFVPTQAGAATGTLTVSDILHASQKVSLSGAGLLPPAGGVVQIAPAQVSFPITGVNLTSTPVTLTIVNANSGPALANLNLSVSPGFKLVSQTCGSTLAVAATCTAAVAFAPTTYGTQNGALTVSSGSLSSPITAPLSGTGFDFTVSAPASQTISSGQTASYSLAIASSPSIAASFTFQCGTLPSYAACVFNPATETIPAGATGSEVVQLTTSPGQTGSARPLVRPGWGIPAAAFGFLLLPAFLRRRREFLILLLTASLAFLVSSCSSSGGGTSGGSPPSSPTTHSTPAGTYSIPVTVSCSGLQHSVTLTLVVD